MTEYGPGAERRAAGTLESEVLGILRAAAGHLGLQGARGPPLRPRVVLAHPAASSVRQYLHTL